MTVNTPPAPPSMPQIFDTLDEFLDVYARTALPFESPAPRVMGSYSSCGISVLAGLKNVTPKQLVDKVLKQRSPTDTKTIREAFVTFSDTDHEGDTGGNAVYKYIKENNLGDITEFGPRMNPNTGNMIKMWVWSPPHASLSPMNRAMPVHGKVLKGNFITGFFYVSSDSHQYEFNTGAAREG